MNENNRGKSTLNFQPILREVLKKVTPSEEENALIQAIISGIEEQVRSLKPELGVDFEIVHVGSTAKGTHLNTGDIDLFFRFSPGVPEERMKEAIFAIGRAVLDSHEIRYAEHPYIRGVVDRVEVDLVPCYNVKSGAEIISAVDRTPFHTEYIAGHLSKGQRDEVRSLKQFMKGIGCYGAENKTMGFSGYLSELLIVHYGDFLSTLEAAAGWKRGTVIDIEDTGFSGPDEEKKRPLLVVDPVDPGRNVASPVSDRNIALFIYAAREFLAMPTIKFFFPSPPEVWDRKRIEEELDHRGKMLFIAFERGDVLDDILYPQLRMAEGRISRTLEERGFLLNTHGFWVFEDEIYLYFEFRVWELPERVVHRGPQVYISEHEKRFLEKWKQKGITPFLLGDRWHVLAPVPHRTPKDFLMANLLDMETGRHIRALLNKGFRIPGYEDIPEEVLTSILDNRMPYER